MNAIAKPSVRPPWICPRRSSVDDRAAVVERDEAAYFGFAGLPVHVHDRDVPPKGT